MNESDTISLIGAIGNWAIAIVAIGGGWIRSLLFKPRLRLVLDPAFPNGDLTKRRLTDDDLGPKRQERYYHLRLTNDRPRRFPSAHEARVLIRQVETPGPDGLPQVAYIGMLPLIWSYSQIWPIARTVGPAAVADLLYVADDHSLHITSMITPYIPKQGNYTGKTTLWLTLQAQSIEADSEPLRLKIAWDGQWELGETEMAKHLQIKVCR